MRIILVFLFFIPTIVFSQINQIDSNGFKQGVWQKKQANGRLMYEGEFKDDKPIGEWKRYHTGGQVKAQIVYSGDTAKTVLLDIWRKKVASGNYISQKKEGIWKIFKQNRVVADEEYKLGLKHGLSHQYYDTGKVMEEKHWRNNKEEGNRQVFYKNGKPYLQCKMHIGMRNGLFLIYFENGQQELIGEYKNNLRHGEWKYQNQNGEELYTLIYDTGKIQNPSVRDSISNLKMKGLGANKDAIIDPEKFMQDPSEYIMKNRKKK